MRTLKLLMCGSLLFLGGCGDDLTTAQDAHTIPVTLPNGNKIRAEMRASRADVSAGMRFRETLPPDRGMIYMFAQEASYGFWTFQVKIPLDIIWINRNRSIVEIVENAPPCPGPPDKCVSYGGKVPAMYVLQVPAGTVKKNDLRVGQTLDF